MKLCHALTSFAGDDAGVLERDVAHTPSYHAGVAQRGLLHCSLVSRILQALRQAEGERLRIFALRISAAHALARFDGTIVV